MTESDWCRTASAAQHRIWFPAMETDQSLSASRTTQEVVRKKNILKLSKLRSVCSIFASSAALLVLSATFRPANLRRECAGYGRLLSNLGYGNLRNTYLCRSALPHPRTHQGHRLDHMAMAFFKGNLIACSGRFGSFGWFYKNVREPTTCMYTFSGTTTFIYQF